MQVQVRDMYQGARWWGQEVTSSGPQWLHDFLVAKKVPMPALRILWAIGMRESGGDPNCVYPSGSPKDGNWDRDTKPYWDTGVWQVNSLHLSEIKSLYGADKDMSLMLDPDKNFDFTMHLSREGTMFLDWGLRLTSTGYAFDWSGYPSEWVAANGAESEAGFVHWWGLWPQYDRTPGPVSGTVGVTPKEPTVETSLNGWTAIQDENDVRLARGTVPGTKKSVLLRKEILPVFLAILSDVNKTVIPLNPGPLDSHEYRSARLSNALSNHASATATDMRYDVWYADNERHCTTAQIAQMHKLLDKYRTTTGKRIFGWGGDWTPGRSCDEMHLELIQSWSPGSNGSNCTLADVQNVIKRLGIRADGTVGAAQSVINIVKPSPPKPAPVPVSPIPVTTTVKVSNVQLGDANAQVGLVQKALRAEGLYTDSVDGKFGTNTKSAYAAWQRRCGYSGTAADGAPGLKTLTLLGNKYKFLVTS